MLRQFEVYHILFLNSKCIYPIYRHFQAILKKGGHYDTCKVEITEKTPRNVTLRRKSFGDLDNLYMARAFPSTMKYECQGIYPTNSGTMPTQNNENETPIGNMTVE
jgi:hypothetical protein